MAGQVKYDILPFIDTSGKDSFEAGGNTSNGSQDVKTENKTATKSEDIESTRIDHAKSFSKFQNKYLDTSRADFSDSISLNQKTGFDLRSIYEIVGERVVKETPQQKYQRLQSELAELSTELEQIKELNETKTNEQNPVLLAEQVKKLQTELHNLHLEKVLGPATTGTNGVEPGTWSKQISSHLKSFNDTKSSEEGVKESGIVYEMYYKPEHAKFSQTSKISELENKLKAIENYVGKDTGKMQTVISDPDTQSATLMDTTAAIHAKLTLFDVSHIEIIAARLQGLLHCINEISQKKETIENAERETKINELHQLVTSWESVASVVPDLIERLTALRSLNDQATNFSQSLDHLSSTQHVIRDQLRTQKDTLDKYEKSFAVNVQSIQANCASLESRITELMKKVGS
ncbi:dynactin subunit 2-like [Clytia hemisphaerica]|uniref:Dynactin subunit 2 n=1 Tax=Clytia hemisphaerica TaxID=252671 RepID=A0A7M5WUG6_9CNID